MIDIVDTLRIARAVNFGEAIPRLKDVARLVASKNSTATTLILSSFRNRYNSGNMSAEEAFTLANWSGVPAEVLAAGQFTVELKYTKNNPNNN